MSLLSKQSKISFPILIAGFLLGLFLSWSLLSGDQLGRVNLLQLVAIYVFLPIFSLLFSSISLVIGKSWNFAKLISLVPLWSQEQQNELLHLVQHPQAKLYFFYQSQLAALSFSFASLLVLLILLVSTDVNFIWRSTLLNAEQLYWLLDWLAAPWSFWVSAQPELELLQLTQDSRIQSQKNSHVHYGGWWQFIFAAQLFYAFLLRFVAIMACKMAFKIADRMTQPIQLVRSSHSKSNMTSPLELAPIILQTKSDFALNNWCGLNQSLLKKALDKLNHHKTADLSAGPLASHSEQMVAERWQESQLLIVKGWEPPLAELSDFMQNGKGYLLPLDWKDDDIVCLNKKHLDEWRRFIRALPNWQLLQLDYPELESPELESPELESPESGSPPLEHS